MRVWRSNAAVAAGCAVAFALCAAWAMGLGQGPGAADGLLSAAGLATAWLAAAAYVLGAIGLGRLGAPLWKGSRDGLALQAAVGLSIQLTVGHLLGWSGVYGTGVGRAAAMAPIMAGLVLLGHQFIEWRRGAAAKVAEDAGGAAWAKWLIVGAAPGAALLLCAAMSPPGWLWSSEFGGYDALEYHLELPQEWLRSGALRPVDHNVYSYLPGYVEAAFLQLGVGAGFSRGPEAGVIGWGFTASGGAGAIACQALHALMAVMAAWLTGRVARAAVAAREGEGSATAGAAAEAISAGLVLSTAWTIVVGSLAYNEMAMLALLAGALVCALDGGTAPVRRAVVCAWLVGVACGVKPTALTFVGAPVAITLLGSAPARAWVKMAAAGAGVGLVALMPWLVRNWMDCGNPVFPFAARWVGAGRWTADQVERYRRAHRFGGGFLEAVRLLVLPDAGDPAGARHRGMMHGQWGLFFPVAGAAWVIALVRRAVGGGGRASFLLAFGMFAQVVLWLTTTHVQSRFLLPLIVPGAALVSVQLMGLERASPARRTMIGATVGMLAVLVQAGGAALNFAGEGGGSPMRLVPSGAGVFTGEAFAPRPAEMSENDLRTLLENCTPEVYCNVMSARASAAGREFPEVYLLGDATALYWSCPVLYHTTFDRSPLGEAVRRWPDDPAAWTRALRERGAGLVLYSAGEVARLRRSGWYDPDVTPERIETWLRQEGTLVRAWPDLGRALFELRGGGAAGGPNP